MGFTFLAFSNPIFCCKILSGYNPEVEQPGMRDMQEFGSAHIHK